MRLFGFTGALLWMTLSTLGQSAAETGQVRGVVKDPVEAAVVNARVILTDASNKATTTVVTDNQGSYVFPSLQPDSYVVQVEGTGFQKSVSAELKVTANETVRFDVRLVLAEIKQSIVVVADAENAYRVESVASGGPLGTTPILNTPFTVNVISRQLIDDTQSRNVKQAAKYLPLASFQEMQGPEVIRPATRGMQGSNMQNARKDGMGIAVTTPSALEEYEQIEVVSGLGAQLYGPTNPSGVFNFATKRPTEEPLREIELSYEGSKVGTVHADLGGRLGTNRKVGYRVNLLAGDGTGYVDESQLRRYLIAGAGDVRISKSTLIEGNYSYYNLFQHGYPGWFAYAPTTTPLSTAGSKSILLPENAPDATLRGYGQSFSGVDLKSQIGEVRVKQEFGPKWHLVAGALDQVSDRNINTAVNQLLDNSGNYKTYVANSFSALAPRFHVWSDSAYLDGTFNTGFMRHDVVIGTSGYRFGSYSPVTSPAKTALCTENTAAGICQASISSPLVLVPPAAGLFSYEKTSPSTGIFESSIIHQQGITLGDTLSFSPRWLVKLSGSYDWTWTEVFVNNASTGFVRTAAPGGYNNGSPSGSGSILFKPRSNMTVYATLASSIQAPDVAPASSGSTIVTNASQALPPYRSNEVEIGYKFAVRRINFTTAAFRIERPFANLVPGIEDPACGAGSGTSNCVTYKITGNQLNYGVEGMLSGRIFESLMVTGGISVLNPRLTDTGIPATDHQRFVGIPEYKSNIFGEYRLPLVKGVYLNSDWQHVGRRAMDDINSAFVPQYNVFDLGLRYTTSLWGKSTTWRITVNNLTDVQYWSTLGPGSITGQSTGSYLGHLGEPRLITASMRFGF
jgi:iron complex outermembrane receptor protein